MTTELQIRANQQNAQKSIGPKTEEGKRKVSLNSITYGLQTRPVVLQDDEAPAFDRMRNALLATMKPVGEIELLYADRAAVALWRLQRVLALEGRLLLARQGVEEGETPEQTLAREIELITRGLMGLSTYEARLEANFNKAMAEFRYAQELRAHQEHERHPFVQTRHPKPSLGPWASVPQTNPLPTPVSSAEHPSEK